ncbi:MAG: putative transposase, partial [Verrucomicrobiales bacterium]
MVAFSPVPFMLCQDNIQPGQTHLCVIIDDHSRFVTHAAYYPGENTASFHDCLKCVLRKRGVPRKLYTDNGGAFISHHSKQICASIDIEPLHHKPYAGWSKGEIEKMTGTIQLGFEAWIRNRKDTSLALLEINQQLQHWLDSIYHQRLHRKTKEKPVDRHLPSLHRKEIRLIDVENELELERLFYIKTKRKVRADGTIQLGGHYYEVDLSLKGL